MRKLTPLLFLAFLGAVPRGTEVHIAFSGLIAHLFDGVHAPRAVAMRGEGHMLHRAALHIPEASIASSEVPLACDNGDCVLDLRDVALRFPGTGRAHYAPGGSFDTIVPHLGKVTNGEMSALRDEVFDPAPGSVIAASMELPAGNLTATPFETKARYEPDFENRGERAFAREVDLDGVMPRPQLLVRRFGEASWKRIDFKADLIELRMVNEPAPGITTTHHEELFYDLAARPLAVNPLIVMPQGKLRPNDLDALCSNTGCCP